MYPIVSARGPISMAKLIVFILMLIAILTLTYVQIQGHERFSRELILIINVDTLRYDRLGINGNNRNLTPYLDELASRTGVIFHQAYAASNHTRPSVVSLFTGTYPTHHGFWHQFDKIKIKRPNIATVLPDDYISIFVNANPNTAAYFARDFDYWWSEYPEKGSQFYGSAYYPAEYVYNKALGFLEQSNFPDKVLLYIQPADPHDPYFPLKRYPDLFEGDELKDVYEGRYGSELSHLHWDEKLAERTDAEIKNLRNRYDAEVRYHDEQMHLFLEVVSKKYENILFIFTSDHGESFLDHDDSGHGTSLYNEQIKVPFIIIDTQSRFGEPRSTDILVSAVDVLPTIAEVVGSRESLKVDGNSILTLMKFFQSWWPFRKDRVIVSEVVHSSKLIDFNGTIKDQISEEMLDMLKDKPLDVLIRASIRHSDNFFSDSTYKYITNENADETKRLALFPNFFFQPHYDELYRLDLDINERNNLFSHDFKKARNISSRSPLKGKYPEFYGTDKSLTPEELEILKALGYLR